MAKIWERSRRDAKRFAREAKLGQTYYTVADVAQNIAPYEDRQLYSSHTITWESPITGSKMTGHMSAEALVLNFGPVYDAPPRGVRYLGTPGPQVAGPVDASEIHHLDEVELRGLEKRAIEAMEERNRAAKKKAARSWSLFH